MISLASRLTQAVWSTSISSYDPISLSICHSMISLLALPNSTPEQLSTAVENWNCAECGFHIFVLFNFNYTIIVIQPFLKFLHNHFEIFSTTIHFLYPQILTVLLFSKGILHPVFLKILMFPDNFSTLPIISSPVYAVSSPQYLLS